MTSFVGLRTVQLIDNNATIFPMIIIYPTLTPEKLEKIGPYSLNIALDATPTDSRFPLVLISHGNSGSNLVYRTLAHHLASNGFIVGMPEHPGNNRNDNSLANTVKNLTDRPKLISVVLNWFFNDSFAKLLRADNVSVIGHSIGGYTALAAAGGIPTSLPHESPDGKAKQINIVPDPRIKSLVLLAPATIWFREVNALNKVDLPILVYIGDKDNYTGPECPILLQSGKKEKFMPYGYQISLILEGVPDKKNVNVKLIKNAGHFSFLSSFPESMVNKAFLPSQDLEGFNREHFHDKLNDEVLNFLLQNPIAY